MVESIVVSLLLDKSNDSSELSPLNCEILKLLFGNNLNLYNGDTLALAGSDNIKTTNGKKIKIKATS